MSHGTSLCLDFIMQGMGKIIFISQGGMEGETPLPGARNQEGLQQPTSFPLCFSRRKLTGHLQEANFHQTPGAFALCLTPTAHAVF